jgi:hypothetical protein
MSLTGTPTLLINDRLWPSNVALSAYNLSSLVELTLMEDKQFTECPPMTIDPTKQYVATLKTEKGDIVIELLADKAPLTVNSFIFLAKNGWFDGITFHRVLPGFVAQTGDPSGTGYGTPGYAFKNEIASDLNMTDPGWSVWPTLEPIQTVASSSSLMRRNPHWMVVIPSSGA